MHGPGDVNGGGPARGAGDPAASEARPRCYLRRPSGSV
jgi:hypothetical protein